jgi:prepilin-type N-terminal cleavage/methylation domain-containing protein
MTGRRGLTLIEVVIVVAIIAISLSLAGPRIGAGLSRLELIRAERTVRSYIQLARSRAQRSDREQYVVLDGGNSSVVLVGSEFEVLREERLPSSVQIILSPDSQTETLYVAPSGILRGKPVRLRGRTGETEVGLQ